MMDVFAVLVAFLAFIQFFLKNVTWTITKKFVTFFILGGISVLLYFSNSNISMPSAGSINSAAKIESLESTESSPSASVYVEQVNSSNPIVSPSQTPQVQDEKIITDYQEYNIYRSDKVLNLKRGKHYPYICSPGIDNCLGFTMKFSYQLSKGHYAKNIWLVCVRENGKDWIQVGEIQINEGEEKEFIIQFDRAISFTEIVIQRPIDYNNYINTDTLSIFNIIYDS